MCIVHTSNFAHSDTRSGGGGGGWTVILMRKEGNIDFTNRDWVRYENIFWRS